MASIHSTVSALRSQIFNTIHNPTNARTGAKYLRRPLRGAAITKYYPKLPKLATLNAQIGSNEYANWSGLASGSMGEKKQVAGASEAGADATSSTSGKDTEAASGSGSVVSRPLGTMEEMFGAGFSEVDRRPGAGWVQDDKERVRKMETELRHKLGKGPPKKGTSSLGETNCLRIHADGDRSRTSIADEETLAGLSTVQSEWATMTELPE